MRRWIVSIVAVCVWVAWGGAGMLSATPRVQAAACTQDLGNLTTNGSMLGPGRTVAGYGGVADAWYPFAFSPVVPTFEWVNYNANGDVAGTGSEYIWADLDLFDAGIYQTITGLTPGVYYHFYAGFAQAAYDPGDMQNHRTDLIGRQVGVDVNGGTNPLAPTVAWGLIYWDGVASLNIPELAMNFTPLADRATIFIRVVNTNPIGRTKVWFDSICMTQMNPQPVVIPGLQFLPLVQRSQP